jgi:hypothetical protein
VKWWLVVLVAIACLLLMPKKTLSIMTNANDNHSAERMKKLREIKAKKREEKNRAQMKKAA